MIVGIAVDNWKLPIYKKHLDSVGYTYTEHKLPHDLTMIKVSCEFMDKMTDLIMAANKECAQIRCPTCEDN
jgi:hypothetical protein